VIPVHDLLSRIRWDPAFGRGHWELAYLDRVQATLVRLPLDQLRTDDTNGFAFEVMDEDGVTHYIPYHRIRMVWHNGEVVWARSDVTPPRKVEKPLPVRRPVVREPRMRR
jgi:uncharacterized protein (UPF0248 family)